MFADEFHLTTATQTLVAKEFYTALGGSNSTSAGINLISINQSLLFIVIATVLVIK
jgi:hypothetical protein